MEINPTQALGTVRQAAGAPGRRGVGAAFTMGAAAPQAGTVMASSVASASLDGLLSLQEVSVEPDHERNRRARGQARAILEALRLLQHGLLLGGVEPGQVARLAQLTRHLPEAADPALRELVRDVAVRAEVELARLDMACRHRPM